MSTREDLLSRTFVELADTLVDAFDVVDLLTLLVDRCVEILDVSAAGLMLAAPEGDLRLAASSSETMRIVELFELQSQEGPCLDCYRTGEPVLNEDLTTVDGRWPNLAPVALDAGFRSVHALPTSSAPSTSSGPTWARSSRPTSSPARRSPTSPPSPSSSIAPPSKPRSSTSSSTVPSTVAS
jgi:hypothetical protein